jgi:putative glutathione S-transferase
VKDLYLRVDSNYSARFSVPVLWDKQTETIVNNESSEIIRMLNSEFNDLIDDPAKRDLDLYPEEHRKGIDEINEWVYDSVNSGPLSIV